MGFFPKVGNFKCKKAVVFLKIEQNGVQIRIQRVEMHLEGGATFLICKKTLFRKQVTVQQWFSEVETVTVILRR